MGYKQLFRYFYWFKLQCGLNDGHGRFYFFNAISDAGQHKDQCMIMSTSENNGYSWSAPVIISNLYDRRKYTPMSSAFVENKGNTIILSVDYAPPEYAIHSLELFRLFGNEVGSGVFISYDRGNTWIDQISGKPKPDIYAGNTDGLVAGFHPLYSEAEGWQTFGNGTYRQT